MDIVFRRNLAVGNALETRLQKGKSQAYATSFI